jgi:hypothetical protein
VSRKEAKASICVVPLFGNERVRLASTTSLTTSLATPHETTPWMSS